MLTALVSVYAIGVGGVLFIFMRLAKRGAVEVYESPVLAMLCALCWPLFLMLCIVSRSRQDR